jgi:hypothetical protein
VRERTQEQCKEGSTEGEETGGTEEEGDSTALLEGF